MPHANNQNSLLDALLYESPGFSGQWKRWRALAGLNGVDRQRVKFIAELVNAPRPKREDILKAATLLRMLGFLDNAVRLLKKHKAIEEAGEMLVVAGRPVDAAKLLERHSLWELAARCYEQSNLREEAARCFETIGKPLQAAALYESRHRFADAARCYDNARDYGAAAICYANSKQFDAAMKMFTAWSEDDPEEFQAMPLGYIDGLVLTMARTKLNPEFLRLLEARGSVADLVRELLKADKDDDASEIYRLYREDIMDDLCIWAETDIQDGYRALKLFETTGDQKANRYVEQHFSIADVTRQKLSTMVTKTGRPAPPPPERKQDVAGSLVFSQSHFFRDFDSESCDRLWDLGSTQHFAQGAIVVEFGEKPRGLITVLEGEVSLYRRKGREMEKIGTFRQGQTIGESWLLYPLKSEVRAVASTTCSLHVAARSKLQAVHGSLSQQIAARLAKHLLERVKPGVLAAL